MRLACSALPSSLLFVAAAASSLQPPVLPLVVRNPYLSLWFDSRAAPFDNWPFFWNGQTIGMGILARLPASGTVLPLLGRPQDALDNKTVKVENPVFNGFQYDTQSTNLSYTLPGSSQITLVFTSPVTPDSILRQSIPATYLEVIVSGPQDVEIYADVNGMWLTGDQNNVMTWSFNKTDTLLTWVAKKQKQLTFQQNGDRAEWGSLYFTAAVKDNVTYQTTTSGTQRRWFAKAGSLNDTVDTNFRSVQNNEPVWAFSKYFPAKAASSSILFTIAFAQDPVAQLATTKSGALAPMRQFYKSSFEDDGAMLAFHFSDYGKATASGGAFAAKVATDASKLVSPIYADILALSARQSLGGTMFSGNASNPLLFLKEISSDGNFQTVDVIAPAFPFFLYMNPDWLSYMLEPLLQNQLAGLYPNAYSMHDLGSNFPNGTGHPDGKDEQMPVEESGNMLYMAVAYVNALVDQGESSRAATWINQNGAYKLWKQWANFLVTDGLVPANQLSTDDFAGSLENQTDLAVKAIVGIKAMARLAEVMGEAADAANFSSIATSYVSPFLKMALSSNGTHTKLAYQQEDSWGSLYNLFGSALLCFHEPAGSLFPYDLYRNQSSWYDTVLQPFGLPLDTRHVYAKSDWELWTAAIASEKTRMSIVNAMGAWVNKTTTNRPFTDLYDTQTTGFPGINFMARPVVGGHFSVLALDQACNGTGFDTLKAIFTNETDSKKTVQHDSKPKL